MHTLWLLPFTLSDEEWEVTKFTKMKAAEKTQIDKKKRKLIESIQLLANGFEKSENNFPTNSIQKPEGDSFVSTKTPRTFTRDFVLKSLIQNSNVLLKRTVSGDSTGPTFSSQGVVYMVAADDPQVNRVVVVTSETPQNAEAQYLEDLRNIAGIQQAVQEISLFNAFLLQ